MDNSLLLREAENLLGAIDDFTLGQRAKEASKVHLEASIKEYESKLEKSSEDYQVALNALEVLRALSTNSVQSSYEFMQNSVNEALKRIFVDKVRQIELREGTRGNNPQLELVLHVENGVERSLKNASGHGIAQVISLLCTLSLIVFTGGRRFLAVDEVMSGMSKETRLVFDEVLWQFAEIGFQYLIVEHDYTPRDSYVIQLESRHDLSRVAKSWMHVGEGKKDSSLDSSMGEQYE